jgi:hypothetical protein
MTLFFIMLVVKLTDVAAIASFFMGLFKVRNAVGYPVALALAILEHVVLRSTQAPAATWNAVEFIGIAAGLIAACLAFFIGKAIRRDVRH